MVNQTKLKKIQKRKFTGSSVPLGSELGKILINSEDSKKISNSMCDFLHSKKTDEKGFKIELSKSTIKEINKAID